MIMATNEDRIARITTLRTLLYEREQTRQRIGSRLTAIELQVRQLKIDFAALIEIDGELSIDAEIEVAQAIGRARGDF